jgi:uncharacterized cupredoxin-like copper-binding protein
MNAKAKLTRILAQRAWKTSLLLAIAGALFTTMASACSGEDPASAPAPTAQAAKGGAIVSAHTAGEAHPFLPKRLEAVIEIDMSELYFSNPQGEKNPTFRLPAGKTIGIHLHNGGAMGHEMVIGRTLSVSEETDYEEVLTEKVPTDVFFYYGDVKAEVGGAKFGELEVEAGINDIWLRLVIPPEFKGEWELGCFVEGHYEGGMHAKLIVE